LARDINSYFQPSQFLKKIYECWENVRLRESDA
jgi:hypothetical protein